MHAIYRVNRGDYGYLLINFVLGDSVYIYECSSWKSA
jgi:hypothetical protein